MQGNTIGSVWQSDGCNLAANCNSKHTNTDYRVHLRWIIESQCPEQQQQQQQKLH